MNVYENEYGLQVALMEWMVLRYPKVKVRCDLGGIRLPIGLAKKAKKLNPETKGWPDIFIAEPRGKYHGFYIELKTTYSDLFTQNGILRQTKHIQEQAAMLQALRCKGYKAEFSYGFDPTQKIIDNYLDRR